jgi:hypothetical protein
MFRQEKNKRLYNVALKYAVDELEGVEALYEIP